MQFNPEEYTLNRDINYAQAAIPGLSAPILQFVNGNMQTLEMELFLDTYEEHKRRQPRRQRSAQSDVRALDAAGHRPDDIDPATHAPPVLLFTWGSLAFTCVLARASQRFVMFLPDGTPVRARLKVTLQRVSATSISRPRRSSARPATTRSATSSARARRCPAIAGARVRRSAPVARRSRSPTGSHDPRGLRGRAAAAAAAAAVPRSRHRQGVTRRWTAPASLPSSRSRSTASRSRPSCAPRSRACRCTDGLRRARRGRARAREREAALARPRAAPARHARLTLDARLRAGPADAGVRRRGRRARRELSRRRRADVHRHRAGPAPPA